MSSPKTSCVCTYAHMHGLKLHTPHNEVSGLKSKAAPQVEESGGDNVRGDSKAVNDNMNIHTRLVWLAV